MPEHKIDHEAAKKWAGSLGPENTFGVCGPDMLNLARAYLDLLSRERRAVGLLRELLDTAKPEPGTDYQKSIWARSYAFLAERGSE